MNRIWYHKKKAKLQKKKNNEKKKQLLLEQNLKIIDTNNNAHVKPSFYTKTNTARLIMDVTKWSTEMDTIHTRIEPQEYFIDVYNTHTKQWVRNVRCKNCRISELVESPFDGVYICHIVPAECIDDKYNRLAQPIDGHYYVRFSDLEYTDFY